MSTGTGLSTGMSTEPDILTLAQWLSPAYPVGAFAYSHGLELAIREGWISDAETLRAWLAGVLADGSGRSDAVFLGATHRAETNPEVHRIDGIARAFAASAERIRESERQGAAFAATTRAVWGLDVPDLMYPVAVGRAAGLKALPAGTTAAMYLQALASNLVSAAIRLMPLGQTNGQVVLAALTPLCHETAREALAADPDDLWSNAWGSDIASMRHETMEPRLFQS